MSSAPSLLRPVPLRIVVLGYLVRGPIAGLVWHHLQYVLGLARMGHAVVFLEDSGDQPWCYDPSRDAEGADASFGLAYVDRLFQSFAAAGIAQRWAWYDAPTRRWWGPFAAEAEDFCRHADVVLNLSGVNPLRAWLTEVPTRVLVDTDPAFTQIRHLGEPGSRLLAAAHTHFFSFGEGIGHADCAIPADGFPWQPTRQPVVLECWTPSPGPVDGAFTSVMQWESYARREWAGVSYGMKAASFMPYLELPQRTAARFELALGGGSPPRRKLLDHGWVLHNPLTLLPTPWAYRQFIRASLGEFSVAKQGYVVSRSGWFSERSAAYLASARPVITQDTGFSRTLPVGEGLLCFQDPEQALAAIEQVRSDVQRHCRAARQLACREFGASTVLQSLLDRALG